MSDIGRTTLPLSTSSMLRVAGRRISQPGVRSSYRYQVARLASFEQWQLLGKLSPLTFSNAGFCCVGAGDAVACFCCGLMLGQWTAEMRPSAVHAKLCGGQCTFISDPDHSSNVAIGGVRVVEAYTLNHMATVQQSTVSGARGAAVPNDIRRRAAVTANARRPSATLRASIAEEVLDGVLSSDYSRKISALDVAVNAVISSTPMRNEGHTSSSPVTARNMPVAKNQHGDEAVKHEAYRLSTFANVWEYSGVVSPRELAAAGFYYAGPGDRVQCAFCQGLLRNWEHGDRAMALHAQHFTYCRFIQGHDVGNVPIPFFPLQADWHSSAESAFFEETDCDLGIMCAVPKHPDFAMESRRQATFRTWPGSADDSSVTEAIAKAGFFYLGNERALKCFYCDGTIEEWPLGADPWAEHARCYPDCTFVIQAKGRGYVQQCGSTATGSADRARRAEFAVDPREIRARLDSSKVRILLRMEYPLDLLREVIQKRLAATGYDHETSESLLADVFAVHDEKQRTLIPAVTQGTGQLLREALPIILAHAWPLTSTHDPIGIGMPDASPMAGAAGLASPSSRENTPDASSVERDGIILLHSLASLPSAGAGRSLGKPKITLSDENQQLKMQLTCKICMDNLIGIVFLPCGHFVSCPLCAPALTECPICRISVRGTVRCQL